MAQDFAGRHVWAITDEMRHALLAGLAGAGTAVIRDAVNGHAKLESDLRVRIDHAGRIKLELFDNRDGHEVVLAYFDVPFIPDTTTTLAGLRAIVPIHLDRR